MSSGRMAVRGLTATTPSVGSCNTDHVSKVAPTYKIDEARVREAMKRLDIPSEAELARKLGVNRSTVQRWLKEGRMPAGDNLANLAGVLQSSIPYLQGAPLSRLRPSLILACRELSEEGYAPEAVVIEAMSDLSFNQRRALAEFVLRNLPTIKSLTPMPTENERNGSSPAPAHTGVETKIRKKS